MSAPGPNERLGIDIVRRGVLIDGLYQFGHTGKHASAQSFDCDVAKETLDHDMQGDDIVALTSAQLATLTTAQANALTTDQLGSMTTAQLASLSRS